MSFMAQLCSMARSFLLVGLICCGPLSVAARSPELSRGSEALGGEMLGDQLAGVAPATNQKNRDLSRLALLTSPGRDHDEYVVGPSEPFGGKLLMAPVSDLSAKWAELQSRILSEQETLVACQSDWDSCRAPARRFIAIIELARQRDGRARLGEINRAVNLSIRPASDWELYGVDDFWSAPLATFSIGAGDCEDYAIAKYVAFRESGMSPDDLRLVILRDLNRNINHAVVAVRQDQEWLILDNRTLIIVNAEEARHYHPLMVLDHRGARAFGTVAFLP
jgi:predicted transglutaminase-like cysteine proteinase